MDPLTLAFLAVFGFGYLSGSHTGPKIVKATKATTHAIAHVIRHPKKSLERK